MKPFYVWEDVNDPFFVGPSLGRDGNVQFTTKALAKADFKNYASEFGKYDDDWNPKLQLYKISLEKVK